MQIEFSVVLIGLDNSGKSTIINSIKNIKEEFFPSTSFNIDYVNIQKISKPILCYDCSGSGMHRRNWRTFYSEVNAIMFVIDSSDLGRIKYAKQQLIDLTKDNIILQKKIPICIMLNKIDKKKEIAKEVFYNALQIQKLQGLIPNKIYLKQTSGYTKQGVEQCFFWLKQNI